MGVGVGVGCVDRGHRARQLSSEGRWVTYISEDAKDCNPKDEEDGVPAGDGEPNDASGMAEQEGDEVGGTGRSGEGAHHDGVDLFFAQSQHIVSLFLAATATLGGNGG